MRLVNGVEMLDVREAASLARRTPETIRRWVWAGRLTAQRDSNRLLVARDEVARLVDGPTAPHETSLSLREWAADVAALRQGSPGATALDLIIEDRDERSGDAGR